MLNRKRYARKPQYAPGHQNLRCYEVEKAAWIAANPNASSYEYQSAMTRLAARFAA